MATESVKVDVTYTDKRTITLNKFNDRVASLEFARLVQRAVADGYIVTDASEITGGNQRDPYTIGIKITLERKEPPTPAIFRDRRPPAFS